MEKKDIQSFEDHKDFIVVNGKAFWKGNVVLLSFVLGGLFFFAISTITYFILR